MFGLTTLPKYLVTVLPADYAGRSAYRYTVACAETGLQIAAGWGESLEQAQLMVHRITTKAPIR